MTIDATSLTNSATAGLSTGDTAAATLESDFTNFLTLLTTQLQYQDPLDPLDSGEFTQQLVSFTSVEQAVQQNQNLESIMSQLQTQNMSNAVDYLGKEITIGTAKAGVINGNVNWEYTLAGTADDVELNIKDESGRIVDTLFGEEAAGTHDLSWTPPEGTNDDEIFTLEISASTGDSNIETNIYSIGKVDSIETFDGSIYLSTNGILVSPDNVLAVE